MQDQMGACMQTPFVSAAEHFLGKGVQRVGEHSPVVQGSSTHAEFPTAFPTLHSEPKACGYSGLLPPGALDLLRAD